MYASLSRFDLVVHCEDGLRLVFTDHRSAAEIATEPELSVLLAVSRLTSGRRFVEEQGQETLLEVVYSSVEAPPLFLHEAIVVAGGVVELPNEVRPPAPASAADLSVDDIIARAFSKLSARVLRRLGEPNVRAAIALYEQVVRLSPMKEDDDEAAYWTAVLELSALGGLALSEAAEGQWRLAAQAMPPFAFESHGAAGRQTLPCNRAQRFVERGLDADTLDGLIDAFVELAEEISPLRAIMPSLRAPSERELGLGYRPLVAGLSSGVGIGDDVGAGVLPIVAYGRDGEHTFGLIMADEFAQDAAAIIAEGAENLAATDVEIERFTAADVEIVAVSGTFFAAEKLLDQEFMRHVATMLGATLLAAAVPRRGLLLVVDARSGGDEAEQALTVLYLSAVQEFREGGSRAISTVPMLVHDGIIVGIAEVDAALIDAARHGDISDADVDDDEDADVLPPAKPVSEPN